VARMLAVVLLSGPIGSGKSLLSEHLLQRYDGACLSTSSLLSKAVGQELDRAHLQALSLDSVFQAGEWITDAVTDLVAAAKAIEIVVVDAVRTLDQVTALRKWAAGRYQVVHVHLTAEDHELEARYRRREHSGDVDVPWSSAMTAPGEAQNRSLEAAADLVVDTTWSIPAEVAVRVGARLSRGSRRASRTVDVSLVANGVARARAIWRSILLRNMISWFEWELPTPVTRCVVEMAWSIRIGSFRAAHGRQPRGCSSAQAPCWTSKSCSERLRTVKCLLIA
jgi:adenylate kinase family enzyme